MPKKITVFTPRRYAIYYLAWEYGLRNVRPMLAKLPKDSRGWYDLIDGPFFKTGGKITYARRHADRVCQVIAYQEGRLGKPLTGGGGVIRAQWAA